MAYVKKVIAQDEKLIGIARLHWIYVLKGLAWFLGLAFAGWAIDSLFMRGLMMLSQSTNFTVPGALMSLSSGAMFLLMGAGFFIFFLFVVKVLVTEVALTSRRIIHKEGLIFVKVKQVDVEEIRGENLDLGNLGRILGYGYLMLDCRFVGDVRLPAIEDPERFLRALHIARGKSQDAISVVLGKGNPTPVADSRVVDLQGGPQTPQPPPPEIAPGQPPAQPEVTPGTPGPEIQPTPPPHNVPPQRPVPGPQPVTPQPAQPIPAPTPSEPPLQNPQSYVGGIPQDAQVMAMLNGQPPPAQPMPQPPPQGDMIQPPPVVAQTVALDQNAVAQVVQQVMPQMAQQVVQQMEKQGLLHREPAPPAQEETDPHLIESFDDARLEKDEQGNPRDKLEYVIH